MKEQVFFMDNTFPDTEKLYRAVFPPEMAAMYWKKDGSLSSAAFADPKGLSVERGNYRSDKDVAESMQERFQGRIIYVFSKNCKDVGAFVKYLPSRSSAYHSEIHGSETTVLLSKSQRNALARKAVRIWLKQTLRRKKDIKR